MSRLNFKKKFKPFTNTSQTFPIFQCTSRRNQVSSCVKFPVVRISVVVVVVVATTSVEDVLSWKLYCSRYKKEQTVFTPFFFFFEKCELTIRSGVR